MSGFVHLVGAGPGDPGLLTVAGRDALRRAEVVVYDRLGTEALLDLCPPGAELIDAGKAPGRVAMTQDQTNATLVELARAGRRVVRLKGGDPFVFGRGGEEAEALARAGLDYAVVPGITSAIAAPAYAGIPVTHRGVATSFTVVTGHEDPAKPAEQTDWAALAAIPGTLIILMGMGRLAQIAERLIAAGRPADQPAAAVQWGTTPRQREVVSTLGRLAEATAEAGLGSPAVVVVGPVAGLAEAIGRRRLPLAGRRMVVTRSRPQASTLTGRLRALGAEVIELPAIRIAPLEPDGDGRRWLDGIAERSHLILTSANGVEQLFARLAERGHDARSLSPTTRVVAIGPATAEALAAHGVRADLLPSRQVAEGILEALAEDLSGASILLARAAGGRALLPEALAARGARVDDLHLYRSLAEPASADRLQAALGADMITFTAASTVSGFLAMLDPGQRARLGRPGGPRVASIGPITSAALGAAGLPVALEAAEHTIPGLVAALEADAGT